MRREVVAAAKTIEQAVELGAKELNMSKDEVTYEVLELPKKGFLGIGSSDAKVKVFGKSSKSDIAAGFIEKIIGHMKINAMPKIIGETEDEIKIDIVGENLGTLIGYHGEILDSLQYLTYLAVNKDEGIDAETDASGEKPGAVKISVDIENYRKKREETLQALAKKMAERVLKYGRPVTLEPMNAYERRIIHAAIQDIPGVGTHSVGQENDRRIVVGKEGAAGPARQQGGFGRGDRRPRYNNADRDRSGDKNFRK